MVCLCCARPSIRPSRLDQRERLYGPATGDLLLARAARWPRRHGTSTITARPGASCFFVRDAILAAAHDSTGTSPFANLRFEPSDATIRDENNLKTVFLIFHAGASYLTDGGADGSTGRNSPSDMIDAFIDRSWFNLFEKDLNISIAGVNVKGASGDSIAISELMLCSETSNQDGLNWGIQGILANQMARQLGIPDLFSTSSGASAIGAFCIMDFAGYSAGNGFIPPYPSAWVRAFAGWDNVKTASAGAASSNRVKALTSVLDLDSLHRERQLYRYDNPARPDQRPRVLSGRKPPAQPFRRRFPVQVRLDPGGHYHGESDRAPIRSTSISIPMSLQRAARPLPT